MSKHVSRLITSTYPYAGRLSAVPSTIPAIRAPFRCQTTGGGAADPMKGRGPITWRSFGVLAVAGAGALGFFYYVKNEKDVGKIVVYVCESQRGEQMI